MNSPNKGMIKNSLSKFAIKEQREVQNSFSMIGYKVFKHKNWWNKNLFITFPFFYSQFLFILINDHIMTQKRKSIILGQSGPSKIEQKLTLVKKTYSKDDNKSS